MKSLIVVHRKQGRPTGWLIILLLLSSCYSYVPLTTQKNEVREVITNLGRGYTIMGRLENGKKFEGKFNFSDQENIYLGDGIGVSRTIPIDQVVRLVISVPDPAKTLFRSLQILSFAEFLLQNSGRTIGGKKSLTTLDFIDF